MRDLALFAIVLCTCTVIGFPICLLFPADRFRARFLCAPPIGLGLFAVCSNILFGWGVAPFTSLVVVATAGLAATVAHVLMLRPSLSYPSYKHVGVASVFVAVGMLCLLPAWTGGPIYSVFQGNGYDQIAYLSATVTYRIHDYAFLAPLKRDLISDPVLRSALTILRARPALNIAYAAFSDLTGITAIAGAYAYLAALQANMMFAATFVFANVFKVRLRLALFLGAALTLGFFQQYVFDINAWGELGGQPGFLLLIATVALSLQPERFGIGAVKPLIRIAALFGILLAIAIYVYIEAMAIYGPAGLAAAVVAFATAPRASRRPVMFAIAALGVGSVLALAAGLLFYEGTLEFLYRQVTGSAIQGFDWWMYFQRYLFGREADYLAYLTGRQPGSPLQIVDALFSLPVEAVMAAAGLYYLLPSAAWPVPLAVAYKLLLYGFMIVLFGGAARTVIRHARARPRDVSVWMFAACIAGLAIPFVILGMGQYWSAGKGLSMAAPLLFVILAAPLLLPGYATNRARAASLLFVLVHLGLGAARPIAAADPTGTGNLGLPHSRENVIAQKVDYDWRYETWSASLLSCRHVMIDVEDRLFNRLVAIAATDLKVSWSAARTAPSSSHHPQTTRPELIDQADCLATAHILHARPGQRLIWLGANRATLDFLERRNSELEIGVANALGVRAIGLHAFEARSGSVLRWTSVEARFEVPNDPGAPPRRLNLELWDVVLDSSARLVVKVDDKVLFEGAIPVSPVELSLEGLGANEMLSIELRVTPPLRAPRDPRELGVPLKQLRLKR